MKRIVFASVPGASPESAVPFLRAKGLAEEAVATSGLQHAVIRSAPVVGAGSLWFVATVAGALQIAADRVGAGPDDRSPRWPSVTWPRRSRSPTTSTGDLAGTWALEGPDSVTTDDVLGVLAGPDAAPSTSRARPHVPGSRPLLGRQVSMHVVDALTAPGRADAPDAAERFGLSVTPFGESVRAALASVATAGRPGPVASPPR